MYVLAEDLLTGRHPRRLRKHYVGYLEDRLRRGCKTQLQDAEEGGVSPFYRFLYVYTNLPLRVVPLQASAQASAKLQALIYTQRIHSVVQTTLSTRQEDDTQVGGRYLQDGKGYKKLYGTVTRNISILYNDSGSKI
jgi:hypothetical protein